MRHEVNLKKLQSLRINQKLNGLLWTNIKDAHTKSTEDKESKMSKEDNTGKLEVAVRILGNELVALKMVVDDFKMKWLVYGVLTVIALAWAGGTYGPALFEMVGENNG